MNKYSTFHVEHVECLIEDVSGRGFSALRIFNLSVPYHL